MGQNNTKPQAKAKAKAKTILPTPTLLILTTPLEQWIQITSYLDVNDQLALAKACKWLNKYYKKTKTTILCNSQDSPLYLCSIKALHRHLSQGGWNYLNPILISGSVDYQKIAKSRRNCLYLEKTKTETFEMRKELKCINFHTVMLTSELRNPIPSISFFENSNLKKFELAYNQWIWGHEGGAGASIFQVFVEIYVSELLWYEEMWLINHVCKSLSSPRTSVSIMQIF